MSKPNEYEVLKTENDEFFIRSLESEQFVIAKVLKEGLQALEKKEAELNDGANTNKTTALDVLMKYSGLISYTAKLVIFVAFLGLAGNQFWKFFVGKLENIISVDEGAYRETIDRGLRSYIYITDQFADINNSSKKAENNE